MKLSTKLRYGVRAMLDIASIKGDEFVSLQEVGRRQDISLKYLEQIMLSLKSAGVVKSIRGAKGGYKLARDTSTITVGEIFAILDGNELPLECIGDPDSCKRATECVMHEVWTEFHNKMRNFLDSLTLADLVKRQAEICGPGETMYFI